MIITKPFILNDSVDDRIKVFFKKILDQFGNELNELAEGIYTYPNNQRGIDGLDGINDVFALTERTYVGILNNAIIRSHNNAVTLQEFGVYNKNRPAGRADLFATLKENPPLQFLFEAKLSVVNKKSSGAKEAKEAREYYTKLYQQAHRYYSAEENFYSQKPYIVTITFEWARHKSILDDILTENYKDDCTDFYYLYHTIDAGLLVYGSYSELQPNVDIYIPIANE